MYCVSIGKQERDAGWNCEGDYSVLDLHEALGSDYACLVAALATTARQPTRPLFVRVPQAALISVGECWRC